MKDKNVQPGDRASAGKPGESTAVAKSLTSSGVAGLLKSEFAEPDEKPKSAGSEDPPAGEDPANGPAGADGELPAGAAEAKPGEGDGEAGEKVEGEAGTEGDAEAKAGAEGELPPEMQDALTAWEAQGGPLPEPLQKVVNKRIGRLTQEKADALKRAEAAEADKTRLATEVEQLKSDPNRPAAAPVATGLDEAALTKLDKTSALFLTEAENYLDDSATPEERQRIERYMESERLDDKGLKRRIREVNEFRTQSLPQQREALKAFRAQETTATATAKKYFAKLDDQASPEYADAKAVLQFMPELRSRTPAHQMALGTYVLGLKVMKQLHAAGVDADAFGAVDTALQKAFPEKGAAKPAAARTPPPKAPAGGSAATARPAKVSPSEAVSQRFTKAPTRQNATDLARAALAEA